MATPHGNDETLRWLSQVLHAKFAHTDGPPAPSAGGHATGFFLVMLPDGRGYLLPSASAALASAGLRLTNPQSLKPMVGQRLLWAALRVGIAQHLLPRIEMTRGDRASLPAQLEAGLGRGRLHIAIALGTPGHIREPILQLLTAQAETIGFAKIDWTGRGAAEHEAEILRTLPSYGPVSFLFPRVLYAGKLEDRYVCVTSPLGDHGYGALHRLSRRDVGILRELATWELDRIPLGASSYFETVRGKVAMAADTPQGPLLRSALESAAQLLGDTPIPFCFSHGDFHSSNMKRAGDRVCLLDWENAQPQRPLGYDAFQCLVTGGLMSDHVSPRGIYQTWLAETNRGPLREYLDELGLDERFFGAVFLLSLAERLVYFSLKDPNNRGRVVPLSALVEILSRHVVEEQSRG